MEKSGAVYLINSRHPGVGYTALNVESVCPRRAIPMTRSGKLFTGHTGSVEKMEDANSELEVGAQSIYDTFPRPHGGLHLTRGSYTE
jgi:hypothetical protein